MVRTFTVVLCIRLLLEVIADLYLQGGNWSSTSRGIYDHYIKRRYEDWGKIPSGFSRNHLESTNKSKNIKRNRLLKKQLMIAQYENEKDSSLFVLN